MNDNMKIKCFDEELEVYDERRVVNKNTYSITLNYVPSPTRPLTVENGKTMLTETNGTPNANQYVLDRENGLLLFNQAMKGKVMTINYSAIGLWCISADKVYTNVDNKGKIVETLEDLMKENRQAIESIKTVGDASTVITQLQANIDSVTGLVGNIAEGSSVNEELTKNITSGKGANTTLTNTISSANNKINEMNTWINQHGDIVNLDNRVDTVETEIPKINEHLDKIVNYNVFYNQPKIGKKIVLIGDSTTDVAPAMYKRFEDYYTCEGGILEGANILNRGANGSLLYDRIRGNYVVHGWTMESDINEQGDLYVICYGINDIKTGIRTKEEIREDLKTYIDNILTRTNGNILLRIPNTFLNSENEEESKKGWISPIEKAQEYSNQLWEVYESFRNYDNRLDIIDIPNLTIGRECKEYHPYMLDNVHGNDLFYIQVADEIAEWISGVKKRDFKDFYDFDLILKGNIKFITNGIFEFNTSAYNELMIGDTVIIGNSETFVIENTPIRIDNGWRINTDHDFSSNKYGTVKILREKKKLITSVKSNKNWFNAFIENSNMSYGIRLTVDLKEYDLRDKETHQLLNPKVDISFDYEINDKSFTNIMALCFFTNNPITVSDQAQQFTFPECKINYGVISGYSGTMKYGDITDKRYCHILIVSNLNDNVGLKNLNFSNLKLSVNDIPINLDNCLIHPYGYFTSKSYIEKSNYNKNTIPVYSDIKKEINDIDSFNNWVMADVKTSGNSIYVETVIDLQNYGDYSQAMLFEIAMKYRTSSTNLTKFQPSLFFNNVLEHGNIVGGYSVSAKEQNIVIDEINHYDDIVYFGVSGYRYCHMIIEFKTLNGASDNVADFGEIDLYIDNKKVDFTNLLFKAYNPLEGSKVVNNLRSPNSLIKYSDVINILKSYNLI